MHRIQGGKKRIAFFLLIQKWQKCHPHIGDKEMACLWTQKVCFHGIHQIYCLRQHLVGYPSPRHRVQVVVKAKFHRFSGSIL